MKMSSSVPASAPLSRRIENTALTAFAWSCGVIGVALPLAILGYLLVNGLGSLSWSFLTDVPGGVPFGAKGGVAPAILGSLLLTALGLALAVPVAVGASVYLSEFSRSKSLNALACFASESFAALPSIIFGIFGYAFFVVYCNLKISLLAGALTIAILMLPIILLGSYSALRAVDRRQRDAALAMGVSRWYAFRRVVLPQAWPGILAATVLAAGYATGAAAPVMFTASVYFSRTSMPSLGRPVMTLPTHLYHLVNEGISLPQAYATAFVLVAGMLCVNTLALLLRRWAARAQ